MGAVAGKICPIDLIFRQFPTFQHCLKFGCPDRLAEIAVHSYSKALFAKIGAAWPTKSGSGYNADLIALPVDGKFILLPPKDKEDASE